MRLKSHHKITLTFGLMVAVILSGLYFYLDHTIRDYMYRRIDASVLRETSLAKSYVEKTFNKNLSRDQIDEIADELGKDLNLRVTIIALDGIVKGDSFLAGPEIDKLENHLLRPEVQESLRHGLGSSRRFSTSLHEDMLYKAVPFGKPYQGIVRLAVPLSDLKEIANHLERILWAAIFVSLLLYILISFLASIIITKPIERIAKIAQNIAAGDFSKKASLSGNDEIADLAKAIDFMSQQIRARIEEITASKSRFEAVFLSMIEGVMVVNKEGRILLINRTLKEILRVEHEAVGRKPLEVIRNIEVQEIVDRVLLLREGVDAREMSFFLPEEKILRVHAVPVFRGGETDGAVLVFHDITDLRRLETIRKDFVANVSHELRTPLANIKGYGETLLEGAIDDKENAHEFLRIIYSESDRLAKLVDDLLELARLESGKTTLTLKPCHIDEIYQWVVTGLKIQAADKSVKIRSEIPAKLPKVNGDSSAIAQIFLNLIENAIKYNNPGGEIIVSAKDLGSFIEVSIRDTGIGIPDEDLPRIFERFYRVDKARSRELGGTGLGLSIVKHMVQSHGGEVAVESELGRGTTFRFTLPKA